MKMKRSDWIAVQSLIAGVIAVGLADWLLGEVMGFWPSLIVGLIVAGIWYQAALKLRADQQIVDKL